MTRFARRPEINAFGGVSAVYLGSGGWGILVCRRSRVVPWRRRSSWSGSGMGTVGDVAAAVLAGSTAVRFPAAPYASASGYFEAYAVEAAQAAGTVEPGALDQAAAVLLEAYARGAGVFLRSGPRRRTPGNLVTKVGLSGIC